MANAKVRPQSGRHRVASVAGKRRVEHHRLPHARAKRE